MRAKKHIAKIAVSSAKYKALVAVKILLENVKVDMVLGHGSSTSEVLYQSLISSEDRIELFIHRREVQCHKGRATATSESWS